MAKSNVVQIKLISTADTGYFYVTKKNARAQTNKLELNKYDPVVRKHVKAPAGRRVSAWGTGAPRRCGVIRRLHPFSA